MTPKAIKTTNELVDEYIIDSDVVMAEFLASKTVPQDLTFEEAFEIYIACMQQVNGDEFYTIKEGERIQL